MSSVTSVFNLVLRFYSNLSYFARLPKATGAVPPLLSWNAAAAAAKVALGCVKVAGAVTAPLAFRIPCATASPFGLPRSFVNPAPVTPVQLLPHVATVAMKSLLPERLSATPAHEEQEVSLTCWLGVEPESMAMFPNVELASQITQTDPAPAEPLAVIVIDVCPLAELRQ